MLSLLYPAWEELKIADAPIPSYRADEVLVRVAACGICGSELETFKNRSPRRTPPLIMGHEFCGIVEETGSAVESVSVGDRVVSNSVVPCGTCVRCERGLSHLCASRQIFGMHRPGAFAELVAVPEHCLIPWPEQLSAAQACLAEPLANGVHVYNLTHHVEPRFVLVIGAGPIGLLCQQVQSVLGGATVFVSDVIPERRHAALQVGAAEVFDPRTESVVELVRERTDGEGADLVIDAVGSQVTKRDSLQATRPGGATVWIGLHEDAITLNTYSITLPERTIFGTYAARIAELEQALALMATGAVDVSSWVKTYPLEDGVDAFRRVLAAQGDDIKAVLIP